ncbi:metallophosphoesterase family protein [Microlunatus elymi]|uniref:Metallophosphoesterase family protein n=2 Tax=Microlunatus elymi TaxID=2596828 RepID=A0A516Q6G9_9ACTN|nr:metallophosphoesterase family protein [Microlunatus elymi]
MSDVHGVLPVLDAVLAEDDVRSCDRIVITGDHLSGPQPTAVLQRFSELGEKLILVRGNADRELVALRSDPSLAVPDPVCAWAARQLDDQQVDLLAGLPHPVIMELDGFGSVAFCHGTPRDDDEVVLVDTRMDKWAEVFADLDPEIRTVVCGHTHMPFVRLVDRRLVINPGSIGMPYGRAGGNWALLDNGNVTLRHTQVDLTELRRRVVAGSDYPQVEEWVDSYLTDAISDFEALTVFGPRDGR